MGNLTRILVLFSVLFITVIVSEDLKIGNASNSQLAYVENVKLSSIPLKTRTKNIFYNDENSPAKVIKAIAAIDIAKSEARATVTAGGVGSTFVNIKIKSEKGEGLDYQVQIFV